MVISSSTPTQAATTATFFIASERVAKNWASTAAGISINTGAHTAAAPGMAAKSGNAGKATGSTLNSEAEAAAYSTLPPSRALKVATAALGRYRMLNRIRVAVPVPGSVG